MTENKRFKAHIFDDGVNERYHDGIIDMEKDEDVIVNYQFISNLLNELNDENKELKIDIGILKDNHEIDREIIDDLQKYVKKLEKENKELKDLLKSMANRNDEIWLDNGQIIRLKKVFKGEWTND